MSTVLDLDTIAHLLRTEHGIDNAHVDMTGGGCATIFAGPTREEADYGTRYAAMAGPGTFRYDGPSTGDLVDFYVGPDDDDGAHAFSPADLGARTESDVARIIAAQARKAALGPLSADEVDALGFDGTGRSAMPEVVDQRDEIAVYCNAANESNRRLIAEGVTDRTVRNDNAGLAAVAAWRAARTN